MGPNSSPGAWSAEEVWRGASREEVVCQNLSVFLGFSRFSTVSVRFFLRLGASSFWMVANFGSQFWRCFLVVPCSIEVFSFCIRSQKQSQTIGGHLWNQNP